MNSNNKTLQGLKKVNDRLLGIEIFLLALITILLVAAIFIEVVCRYFLFISAAWAEEFTRYLFIWLTYIGSAYAICDNSHTEIDVLKQVLMKIKGPAREKWLKALEVAAIVSTFAFLVVFAKLFFDYMMDAGAAGVTYGRFVFQYPHVTPLVKTLGQVVHNGLSVKEAMELLDTLEHEDA